MTAKMFVEMQHHWLRSQLTVDVLSKKVDVTYLFQIIPSPYGMPRYDLLTNRAAHFAIEHYDDQCYLPLHDVDFSGNTVGVYLDLIYVAEEFKLQQKFLSRPLAKYSFVHKDVTEAYSKSGVMRILQKNCSRDGLYAKAHLFQRRSVIKWKGTQTPVKLLCCPLLVDNETTTEGCGNVMLSLLELDLIIKVKEIPAQNETTVRNKTTVRNETTTVPANELGREHPPQTGPTPRPQTTIDEMSKKNQQKKKKIISLSNDYENRWLITYGDGLSQMRVRSYSDTINAASVNFREYYEQSTLFSRALDRVVMVPGDLHGGGFHFLGVVFILFYGSFMQPVQYAMGWKRIRGSDVSKTYQQSALLALIVLNEVERGLYGRFIWSLIDRGNLQIFIAFRDSPKELGQYLAVEFIGWLQKRLEESTDEVF
jgi:hypothetical protein